MSLGLAVLGQRDHPGEKQPEPTPTIGRKYGGPDPFRQEPVISSSGKFSLSQSRDGKAPHSAGLLFGFFNAELR